MSNMSSLTAWSPSTETSLPLNQDSVVPVAERTLKNFDVKTFRDVYVSAVGHGITSEQLVGEKLGKDTLRVLQSSKKDPSPAVCKDILRLIVDNAPDEAPGSKRQWRHTQPRPDPVQP